MTTSTPRCTTVVAGIRACRAILVENTSQNDREREKSQQAYPNVVSNRVHVRREHQAFQPEQPERYREDREKAVASTPPETEKKSPDTEYAITIGPEISRIIDLASALSISDASSVHVPDQTKDQSESPARTGRERMIDRSDSDIRRRSTRSRILLRTKPAST
jgi:hypothetical protein